MLAAVVRMTGHAAERRHVPLPSVHPSILPFVPSLLLSLHFRLVSSPPTPLSHLSFLLPSPSCPPTLRDIPTPTCHYPIQSYPLPRTLLVQLRLLAFSHTRSPVPSSCDCELCCRTPGSTHTKDAEATARASDGSVALLGVGISPSTHGSQPSSDPYLAEGMQALKVGAQTGEGPAGRVADCLVVCSGGRR